MPRTSERGGPQTRAKILEVAHNLFLERGYDAVTVAEVAREAGVSSVTVFNHFARKEDLFLDRSDDAEQLLRDALGERAPGVDVIAALHDMTMRLIDERHPLSGVDPRSVAFFRTVAGSQALVARAREIAARLQSTLGEQLERDSTFNGDSDLLAALFIAGYTTVLVTTARRVLAGESPQSIVGDHRARFELLFETLRSGWSHSPDSLPRERDTIRGGEPR
jgi:AcrR family transcriptional regulator